MISFVTIKILLGFDRNYIRPVNQPQEIDMFYQADFWSGVWIHGHSNTTSSVYIFDFFQCYVGFQHASPEYILLEIHVRISLLFSCWVIFNFVRMFIAAVKIKYQLETGLETSLEQTKPVLNHLIET